MHGGVCGSYTLVSITRRSWTSLPLFGMTENGVISVSNTSSLKPGMSNSMDRLIQVDYSPNADPVRFEFEINQLRVDEIYYSRNLEIDESNCTRQDDLQFYFIIPKIIYYAYTGLLLVLLKEVQVYPVPPSLLLKPACRPLILLYFVCMA